MISLFNSMGLFISKLRKRKRKLHFSPLTTRDEYVSKAESTMIESSVIDNKFHLTSSMNFSQLPVEIWYHVIIDNNLSISDVRSLLLVNRELNYRLSSFELSNAIWEDLIYNRWLQFQEMESSFKIHTTHNITDYRKWGLFKLSEETKTFKVWLYDVCSKHYPTSYNSEILNYRHDEASIIKRFLENIEDTLPFLIHTQKHKNLTSNPDVYREKSTNLPASFIAYSLLKIHQYTEIIKIIISIRTKDEMYHSYYSKMSLESFSVHLSVIDPNYYDLLSYREKIINKTIDLYNAKVKSIKPSLSNKGKFTILAESFFISSDIVLESDVTIQHTTLEDYSILRLYSGNSIGTHVTVGPALVNLADILEIPVIMTKEFLIVYDKRFHNSQAIFFIDNGIIEIFNNAQVMHILEDNGVKPCHGNCSNHNCIDGYFKEINCQNYLEMFFQSDGIPRNLRFEDPALYFPLLTSLKDRKFTKMDKSVIDPVDIIRYDIDGVESFDLSLDKLEFASGNFCDFDIKIFRLFIEIISFKGSSDLPDSALDGKIDEFIDLLVIKNPMFIDSLIISLNDQKNHKYFKSRLEGAKLILLSVKEFDPLYLNACLNPLSKIKVQYSDKLAHPEKFIYRPGEIVRFHNSYNQIYIFAIVEPMEHIMRSIDNEIIYLQDYLCISIKGIISIMNSDNFGKLTAFENVIPLTFCSCDNIGSFFEKFDWAGRQFLPNNRLRERLNKINWKNPY